MRSALTLKFADSGFALQDVVNEIGKRLGFSVVPGRYRGTQDVPGHDGLWRFAEDGHDHALIIEVKTTDAFRVDLDSIMGYRLRLSQQGQISPDKSSVLLVVGREDTGGLEAQVRGSRFAWDIRMISAESLLQLLETKEKAENPETHQRIRSVLVPREFTRLDNIVDLLFRARWDGSTDGEVEDNVPVVPPPAGARGRREPKGAEGPYHVAEAFRPGCIERLQRHLGTPLVQDSPTLFSSPEDKVTVFCAVSREYGHREPGYWFGFHPHQREALAAAPNSWVALGCGSAQSILLIPFKDIVGWLDGLRMTGSKRPSTRTYWHLNVWKEEGRFMLDRKKGHEPVDLTQYLLASE